MKYVLRHIATTGLLGAASAVCGLCAGAGGQSAASAAGGRIRRTRHPASQPGHAAAACGAAHCRRLDRPDSAAGWGLHSTVHHVACLAERFAPRLQLVTKQCCAAPSGLHQPDVNACRPYPCPGRRGAAVQPRRGARQPGAADQLRARRPRRLPRLSARAAADPRAAPR